MSTPIVPTSRDNASPNFSALPFSSSVPAASQRSLGGADLGLWEISIIWGIGVSMAVYLAAGVSGAHLNPAVTIALWLFGTFERHRVPAYILAQVAGAFCSAALVYGLYSSLFSISNRPSRWFAEASRVSSSRRSSPPIRTPRCRSVRRSLWKW